MDRRDFLKGTAGLSLAGLGLLLQPLLPLKAVATAAAITAQAQVNGRLLRGTSDGQILESLDAGRSWQRVADFGRHCSIATLREQRGRAYIEVAVQDHRFALTSTDARLWRTLG